MVSLSRQVNQWSHLAQEKFYKQSDKDRLKNVKISFDEKITDFKKMFNSIYIKGKEFFDEAFELEEIIDSSNFELSRDEGTFTKSYFENKIQSAYEKIEFISSFSFDSCKDTEEIKEYCEYKKNQLNSLKGRISAMNHFDAGKSSFLKSDFSENFPSTGSSQKNEALSSISFLSKKQRNPFYKKERDHSF